MKKSAIIVFVLISQWAFGQVIFESIAFEFPAALGYSASQWCDYDNDGDLDIFFSGMNESFVPTTICMKNNGDNTFEPVDLGFVDMGIGTFSWSDFNNDGFIDVLLTGQNAAGNYQTVLYEQLADHTFEAVSDAGFIHVAAGSSDWGDFNNDGYDDLLISGQGNGTTYEFAVYLNEKGQSFTLLETPDIAKTTLGKDSWVDYNNDGWLDIFVSGNTGNSYVNKLYTNLGNKTFEELTTVEFPEISGGYANWFDYDGDGFIDLFLTGHNASYQASLHVFRNLGTGAFEENFSDALDGHMLGNLKHCDVNNDGYPDFLVSGNDASFVTSTKLYVFNGTEFEEAANSGLPDLACSFSWGDFNNDSKSDLFVTGFDDSNVNYSAIYSNNTETVNEKPIAPANLSTAVSGDTVFFSWDAGNDTETTSLSYNLYITNNNDTIIKPVTANIENGYLWVPEIGNNAYSTQALINGLADGQYKWTVQAIDGAFSSSTFAPMETFTVGEVIGISTAENDVQWSIYPNPARDYFVLKSFQNFDNISLIDASGKIILGKISVDEKVILKNIKPGLYLIVTKVNNIARSQPIIIN